MMTRRWHTAGLAMASVGVVMAFTSMPPRAAGIEPPAIGEIIPLNILISPNVSYGAEKLAQQVAPPYRLIIQLKGDAPATDWRITVASETRELTIGPNSASALDRSILSQVVTTKNWSLKATAGIPLAKFVGAVIADPEAAILNTVDTANPDDRKPQIWPMNAFESRARSNPAGLKALNTYANAMVALASEDRADGKQLGCSAFLVTPELLLTNRHCVQSADSTPYIVRGWLRAVGTDRFRAPTYQKLTPVHLPYVAALHADARHDFALMRLTAAETRVYPAKLSAAKPVSKLRLLALQFPNNLPLSLNMDADCIYAGQDQIGGFDGPESARIAMIHGCDTAGGSSGSPIIDRKLAVGVVGLHYWGHLGNQNMKNRAVYMASILDELKLNVPKLWKEITEAQGRIP